MSKKAIKAAAHPLPTSRIEAEDLLAAIGLRVRALEKIDGELTAQVAGLKLIAQAKAEPLAAEVNAMFKALAKWAARERDELLAGDRRSVDLASGTIGWRKTPPRVVVADEDIQHVVKQLQKRGLARFLRTEVNLDKQAILKEPDALLGMDEISVEDGEFFYATPREFATELQLTGGRVKRTPLKEAA